MSSVPGRRRSTRLLPASMQESNAPVLRPAEASNDSLMRRVARLERSSTAHFTHQNLGLPKYCCRTRWSRNEISIASGVWVP
ncbi:hypothetical protein V2G26_010483 [Clonostachys chloroleuca]